MVRGVIGHGELFQMMGVAFLKMDMRRRDPCQGPPPSHARLLLTCPDFFNVVHLFMVVSPSSVPRVALGSRLPSQVSPCGVPPPPLSRAGLILIECTKFYQMST